MKQLVDYTPYGKKQDLNEIYQKSGMRFAFLSAPKEGNKQCTPWVKCRDYLHDTVRSHIQQKPMAIYGFSYTPKEDPPIDLLRIRIIIKNSSKSEEAFKKNVMCGVALINHYEDRAGLKSKTSTYHIKEGIWLVNGSNFWLRSPALTSIFTFLLRLGELEIDFKTHEELEEAFLKHSDKNSENNDKKYLWSTYDVMDIFIRNVDNLLDNKKYDVNISKPTNALSVNEYHNYMGILSLCEFKYKDKDMAAKLKKIINEEILKEEVKPKVVAKKELLRVVGFGASDIYDAYRPEKIYTALVSTPEDGRKQCHEFTSCRESLNTVIRAILCEDKGKKAGGITYLRGPGAPKIDVNKLRLLTTIAGLNEQEGRINKHKKELFFAKKVLNYYEEMYGIEKSTISTVKIVRDDTITTGWLFTGDAAWIKSPVMLSSYILILRAARQAAATVGTLANINIENLLTFWEKNYKINKIKDSHDIHNYHNQLMNIISNRLHLFTESIEDAYYAFNESDEFKYSTNVGIKALINGAHVNKELTLKAKQIGGLL